MAIDHRLTNLLSLWDAGRKDGQDLSPEELCRDCPGLLGEFVRVINRLRRLEEASAPAFRPAAHLPVQLTHLGKYEVMEKVGEGAMGMVYKCRDPETHQIVAAKAIRPEIFANKNYWKCLEREFRLSSSFQHFGLVRTLEYNAEGPIPFLVMEFVEGESLDAKLQRDGPFSEAEAIRLIVRVCQALHATHKRNLIHRDVKPSNIMVTPDGQSLLCDLGLAMDLEADEDLTPNIYPPGTFHKRTTFQPLGTPYFMAPEQCYHARNANISTDLFSLGATLYMMVTGELPHGKCDTLEQLWSKIINRDLIPPRQLRPELSERIDWAIRRAMSPDPQQRPRVCREFVEDLIGRSLRKRTDPEVESQAQDQWYVVYKEKLGTVNTVKGGTECVRQAILAGRLGDGRHVRACRTKSGPFELLQEYAEFRDLVIVPTQKLPAVALKAFPAQDTSSKAK